MKNPKQLVSTSIIATLILSNAIIGDQYIKDTRYYESKIHSQYKIIKHYKEVDANNKLLINQNEKSIKNLNTQLDQLKQENEQLKKDIERRKEMNKKYFIVTAYTSNYESTGKTSGSIAYRITASGTKVQEGRTIACPPSLDFGTKLNIENVGLRVCEDRGGAIKNNVLDLYVESLSQAIEFGKQTLLVEILD